MRVITKKRLTDFSQQYPECATALNSWYRIIRYSTVENFAQLKAVFPSADQVKGLTVFNIGGNKIRLIAAIHYNTQRMYIRHVLTHGEYDKNKWKKG